jgi:hypothetical protein
MGAKKYGFIDVIMTSISQKNMVISTTNRALADHILSGLMEYIFPVVKFSSKRSLANFLNGLRLVGGKAAT